MATAQNLDEVLTALRLQKKPLFEKFGVQNLAVFGSYLKNAQRAESDVDIFVELEPNRKTFDNFMDLKFFLEDTLHQKIDLAVKESIREEIRAEVFDEAIYV